MQQSCRGARSNFHLFRKLFFLHFSFGEDQTNSYREVIRTPTRTVSRASGLFLILADVRGLSSSSILCDDLDLLQIWMLELGASIQCQFSSSISMTESCVDPLSNLSLVHYWTGQSGIMYIICLSWPKFYFLSCFYSYFYCHSLFYIPSEVMYNLDDEPCVYQ